MSILCAFLTSYRVTTSLQLRSFKVHRFMSLARLLVIAFVYPDPVSLVRDHNVKEKLVELGISVQSYNGDLLFEPWEVYDDKGLAFTTFEAYWEKCFQMPMEPVSLLPPWKLIPTTGTLSKYLYLSGIFLINAVIIYLCFFPWNFSIEKKGHSSLFPT